MLGGRPAFEEKLHVGRPNIGDRKTFHDRVSDILDRRWLTNDGHYVDEFERRVAKFVGVEHCVAMCNATIALEIAIRALGLVGEVIMPSFTFIATAHALQWHRIKPVFCDIDPRTHNLDPERVEEAITPRTSGIVGVHVWGRACEINDLSNIASRHNLKLLFDSAQAFSSSYQGRMIGGFGDAEVFSFHATKVANSFEGGTVTTNDGRLAEKIRSMRNFGFTLGEVTQLGINGKMTEVCAAMGLTSLESLDEVVALNRRNYKLYRQGLHALPGISLVEYDQREENNYHHVVIEVDPEIAPLNRNELLAVLRKENVLARTYFWPGCHQMEPYKTLYPVASSSLAQTERLAARVISLPTGQVITPEIVSAICRIVRVAFENAQEIRALLKATPERSLLESVV